MPVVNTDKATRILALVMEIAENEWSNGACDGAPHFAIHIDEQSEAADRAFAEIQELLGIPDHYRRPYRHSRHT
jgi:hypothetical protein